jgi:MipA family protein
MSRVTAKAARAACCALALAAAPNLYADNNDTVLPRGLLPERDGRWGLGIGTRVEQSPYRGESGSADLYPILTYEGERVYLRGTRGGLRLIDKPSFQLEAIAQGRLTNYRGESGQYLEGMFRTTALDAGLSAIVPTALGEFSLDVLGDISDTHHGYEVAGAWARNWDFGALRLRPTVILTAYSRDLADYYYGVQAAEARPDRPAYSPGSSASVRAALYGSYRLTKNNYLIGSLGVTRYSGSIGDSPIVESATDFTAFAGYQYRFGDNGTKPVPDASGSSRAKWSVRVARGWNAEASLLGIIPGGDFELSPERTGVASIEVGRMLDERFNDWPVDIWVKGAYMRYLDKGIQPDGNGIALYLKGFYYGFPWSKYVKTRFGMGQGLSWVDRVPALEQRDIEKKNPNTSHLLCALDVSVDVSVGDIVRYKPLQETYFGVAVIHRSGIFGSADMFNDVDGGSNYISLYVESVF